VVRATLDLGAIMAAYDEPRGYPPYHPAMMVALLLYAYTQGIYASRRIAKACEERLDFMALTAMARPDFRTISAFRKRHLAALAGLFLQVLALCRQAGLVQLGHVALDRTKIKANASKHKAMKAKDGFVQACNAQAAVDAHGQIAVACTLTNNAADQAELGPLLDPIAAGLGGSPKEISADVGYCSEANLETLAARGIRGYVATGRQKHPATGAAQRRGPLVDAMRTRLGRAGRPHALSAPKADRRAGHRPDQAGPRLPPVPAPRPGQGQRRMGAHLHRA
jgi:transposase